MIRKFLSNLKTCSLLLFSHPQQFSFSSIWFLELRKLGGFLLTGMYLYTSVAYLDHYVSYLTNIKRHTKPPKLYSVFVYCDSDSW